MKKEYDTAQEWLVMAKNSLGYPYIIYTCDKKSEAYEYMERVYYSFKMPEVEYVDTHVKGFNPDLETFDIIDLRTKELYVRKNNNIDLTTIKK